MSMLNNQNLKLVKKRQPYGKSKLFNFTDWLQNKKTKTKHDSSKPCAFNDKPYQAKVGLQAMPHPYEVQHNHEMTCLMQKTVQNQKHKHHILSVFMIFAFVLFTLYTLFLPHIIALKESSDNATPMSSSIILFFSLASCLMMWHLKKPLSYFGLSLKNAKRHALKSLYYTVVACALITMAKTVYMQMGFGSGNETLFTFGGKAVCPKAFNVSLYMTTLLLYFVTSPFQELIARGVVQTLLYHHLPGGQYQRTIGSILIPNLLFCAMHAHLSLTFAALVVMPGLFWGYLFHQQRAITGVVLSHMLFGFYAFFILGPLT